MLITCSSCNSKYLVNSAELKPSGRNVKCAKCGNSWFQDVNIEDQSMQFTDSIKEENDNNKDHASNLPSTYVKAKQASLKNSILLIFFVLIIIFIFFVLKENGVNFFILINYYVYEFYFNLKLLINDLAKIIYQIVK